MIMVKELAAAALALAFASAPSAAAEPAPKLFTLSSPAFSDNAVLPLKYAGGTLCGKDSRGGNISPPLAWSNPPSGTKSFALVMVDPDGRRGLGSVHWLAYNMPASRTALQEGEGGNPPPADVTPGKNSRGTPGYTGPCGPPADAPHHYVIDVLALDRQPGALAAGLDRDQLFAALAGHSLAPASLVVRYRREP
jgi:Raf kinase inhibitor-like YbhB/YbcL family protein